MSKIDSEQEAIAFRLKEARKLAGLSQSQVANMLGLQRPSVSEIEAGRRKVSAQEITKLADIYDVDAGWLMGARSDEADVNQIRVELAARELSKLKGEDLDRLLKLLVTLRSDEDQ